MKKTTKKISALLLAAVMTVSLAACGKTAPPAPNSSESAPTSDGGAGQSADKNTGSTGSFDLATTEFLYTGEFRDGYAWAQPRDGKVSLIDKKGNIKFQVDKASIKDSSFENGVGYIDGKIMDLDGNVTYTLNTNSDDDGIAEKMIMQGSDKFLIERRTKNMKENSTKFTVIDKNGVDLVKPIEVESDSDPWFHLGEGIFCQQYGYNSNGYNCNYILNPNTGASLTLPKLEGNEVRGFGEQCKAEGGKAWGHDVSSDRDRKLVLYDLATMEEIKTIQAEDALSISGISGKTAYINDAAYDLSGNKIADFPINGYKDTPIVYIGEYSDDGYVPVILRGKDGSAYITYLDKSGNERFSPIKISSDYQPDDKVCTPTHFISRVEGSTVTLYDNSGAATKTEISLGSGIELFEDYIISNGKYYFF